MKVKVHYNPESGDIKGYYPNSVNYSSIPEPYIEINESEQDKTGKIMCVVDGIYQEYIKPDSVLLQESKDFKIQELKQKRDEANILDMNSHQATELIPAENNTFTEGGLVYFSFRTKPTGNPATEPTSILTNIMVKNGNLLYEGLPTNHYLPYSCAIIEGESVRVGYVKLDFELAKEIVSHMELRNSTNIRHCNELEAQVEAATTIEEINNIVW